MDKSKWEYKKLGEVCDLYQPKTISSDMLVPDGKYLVYGANGVIGKYNKYNHENSEVLMTCRGATCGTINVSAPYSWINGNAMVVHPRTIDLNAQYLVYQLKAADKTSVITGAAQPQITRQMLQTLPFVVAPITDQQRIVAELDCLNEMIALKQGQLKEFDKLAQSIFYDMFGDPVENTKGWKQCLLKDVTSIITDGDHMPPPKSETGVPFVTISNVDKEAGLIDFSDTFFVPQEYYDNIPDNKKPHVGDILYTVTGSYGIPILIKDDKAFCFQRHIGLIRPISEINPVFMCLWAGCQPVKRYADRVATGVAQKTVSLKALRNFPIILPPLALQQQFAEKIQAIEAQKELVKQSIAETQQLLDSRMDYYFD